MGVQAGRHYIFTTHCEASSALDLLVTFSSDNVASISEKKTICKLAVQSASSSKDFHYNFFKITSENATDFS